MGWTGIGRTCNPDTIGDYDGTPTEPKLTTTSTSGPAPTPSGGNSEPIGEKFEGAPPNCSPWYKVQKGDACRSIEDSQGIAVGTIKKLNKGVDSNCGNSRSNVNYCLAVSG
ncbi:hypothetical protein P171DRAFT_490412 [Karstenula rhodostoma CBS 690.94]|uniref:LysM domain-containing protein n=1 Tax=Karstenula rhodostoma CBS 690.94 TaxID=1392251 RepID=A0A9P4P7R6_9PLEO|nr:hypothetical protein P171DRAFT_490412 [Karstenula rhodostoma CBS 690.94]